MFSSMLCILCYTKLTFANDDNILSKFTQSDYQLKDLRIELEHYNEDFINSLEYNVFKPNRSQQAINASVNFKVDVYDKLEVSVQAYKFLSNEYRHFPVYVHFSACKVIEANVIGIQRLFTCGNMTKCYFKKDITYYMCNLIADLSKLPPLIPDGRFMVRVQIIFQKQVVTIFRGYGEVYRPIYPPKEKY